MNIEDATRTDKVLVSSQDQEAARDPVSHGAMWYRISAEPDYIRAELFHRQTVEETRQFLEAVLAEVLKHRRAQVLIYVRNSKAIFTVERYGFSRYMELAFKTAYKIALMGDSWELRVAHQYVATLSRLRGVKLRTFLDEAAALEWLRVPEGPLQ
jgi:hypothetical protein